MRKSSIKVLRLLVLSLACFTLPLFADDILVTGGASADGRYQVRVFLSNDPDLLPSNYYYGVVDAKSGKLIKKLDEGGGFISYEGAKQTSKVLWREEGDFFALIDHGARHSMDLYVYEVKPSSVVLIQTPDYLANALGRIGAVQCYGTEVVEPRTWKGNSLICEMDFDGRLPAQRTPVYRVRFELELHHGLNQSSALYLKSMSDPK
jgi:hypothetical protein